jgi:hypothetical protein
MLVIGLVPPGAYTVSPPGSDVDPSETPNCQGIEMLGVVKVMVAA